MKATRHNALFRHCRGRRPAVGLVVLFVLSASSAFPAWPAFGGRRAAQANNDGVNALEAGRFDEAIGHFKRALELNPNAEVAKRNLAGAYKARGTNAEQAGRYGDARHDFLAALALFPNDEQTKRMLAVLANNDATDAAGRKDFAAAVRHFEEAVSYLGKAADDEAARSIRQNFANVLTQAGNADEDAGRLERARAAYRRALALDPDQAVAMASLGNLEYDDNNHPEALRLYSGALALLSPEHGEIRSFLQTRLDTLREEMEIERTFVFFTDRQGRFRLYVPETFAPAATAPILKTLNEAYMEVGRDFDHYSSRPISAKVYTRQQMESTHKIPAWVVGVYDGKLRLLDEQVAGGRAALRNLVYHEFTHAVVQQMGGDKVPSWLHEGLAQIEEPERTAPPREVSRLAARVRAGQDKPLGEMTEPFQRTRPGDSLPRIYLKSRMVAEYLLKKYDWEAMRELLRKTRRLDDFDAAFLATYGRSVDEMETEWRRWMLSTTGNARSGR